MITIIKSVAFPVIFNAWVNCHHKRPGTGYLWLSGIRCLNLVHIYYVLISKLSTQILIMLMRLILLPTLAISFLTNNTLAQEVTSMWRICNLWSIKHILLQKTFPHMTLRENEYILCKYWVKSNKNIINNNKNNRKHF